MTTFFITVTTGEDTSDPDDGFTSLREAVALAAEREGAETITFAAGIESVVLGQTLTISDPGVLTIDGDLDEDGLPDVTITNDGSYVSLGIPPRDPRILVEGASAAEGEGPDVTFTGLAFEFAIDTRASPPERVSGEPWAVEDADGRLSVLLVGANATVTLQEVTFPEAGIEGFQFLSRDGADGGRGRDTGGAAPDGRTGAAGGDGQDGADGEDGADGYDMAPVINDGTLILGHVAFGRFSQTLAFGLDGGSGGDGGRGGRGQEGGDGIFLDRDPGRGGPGGTGGDGGDAGRGGDGGEASFGVLAQRPEAVTIFEHRVADIATFRQDPVVPGGDPGRPGAFGEGGIGGLGGDPDVFQERGPTGARGLDGRPGSSSSLGSSGEFGFFYLGTEDLDPAAVDALVYLHRGGADGLDVTTDVREGETISYTVVRLGRPDVEATVNWALEGDGVSLVDEVDGPGLGGTLSFDENTDVHRLTFDIRSDGEVEPDMIARLTLSEPTTGPDNLVSLGDREATFRILDVNDPPANLALSPATVEETVPIGTEVGVLSADDPEGRALTWTLTLDPDGLFTIAGDRLVTTTRLDHETRASSEILVTATDPGGLSTTETFTVSIADVNELPTAPALDGTSVPENAPAGTLVGRLSSSDPEGGAITFSLAVDADGRFAVDGDRLVATRPIDHEATPRPLVQAIATDPEGNAIDRTFAIDVTDVNEPPGLPQLDGDRVEENAPRGTPIGEVSATDPEGGALAFRLLDDAGGAVRLDGTTLVVDGPIDFERTERLTVAVEADDDTAASAGSFEIEVVDVSDPTEGPDRLAGTAGPDRIEALGGDDSVRGLAGDDTVLGGDGDDVVGGAAGSDSLSGGPGGDRLVGGGGRDRIDGGAGPDEVSGGGGGDRLQGGDGRDRIEGDGGRDLIDGGDGPDLLGGGGGRDVIVGGTGSDGIAGGAGPDRIDAGAGDDTVAPGTGNDRIDLGEGRDTLIFAPGDGRDRVTSFGPDDRVDFTAFEFENLRQLVSAVDPRGGDTALRLGDGDVPILEDIAARELGPDNAVI